MVSLNSLCSELRTFQKKLLKKIRKVHKKIFCGPSKILKNISWHINIYLKYFMPPEKTLCPPHPPTPPYILNIRSLKEFDMLQNDEELHQW